MNQVKTEWFGEIPENWEISTIGNLYSERHTKVSDTEYMPLSVTMKGVLPQLATAAKTDAHDDRKLLCEGDFAINSRSDRRGSCGISAYTGSVSLINTVLCPRTKMNAQYYNWLFHTVAFADEFYKYGHGIVDDLWTTNWQDMKKINIPVPTLDEQHRIADFLDRKCTEIDSVTEQTKASIEEYKTLKQSIITETVTKGIRKNRPMKDSGIEWIGEIPEEWKCCLLKFLLIQNDGGVWGTDPINNAGDIVLRSTEQTIDGKWYIVNPAKRDLTSISNLGYYKCKKNDLLITKSSGSDLHIGKTTIVSQEIEEKGYYYSNFLQRIRLIDGSIARYFWYVLNSPTARAQFAYIQNSTSGIGNLNASYINNLLVPVPQISEQAKIAEYLDTKCAEIDKLIEAKQQLLAELETYKKSIIYEYVTGKEEV